MIRTLAFMALLVSACGPSGAAVSTPVEIDWPDAALEPATDAAQQELADPALSDAAPVSDAAALGL